MLGQVSYIITDTLSTVGTVRLDASIRNVAIFLDMCYYLIQYPLLLE